jgi:hypothetical protein
VTVAGQVPRRYRELREAHGVECSFDFHVRKISFALTKKHDALRCGVWPVGNTGTGSHGVYDALERRRVLDGRDSTKVRIGNTIGRGGSHLERNCPEDCRSDPGAEGASDKSVDHRIDRMHHVGLPRLPASPLLTASSTFRSQVGA